jgi:type I restriction enzyme S subunit
LQSQALGRHDAAAAVPGINRNVLHELPVATPNLRIQLKIAAILSAYDDLIANNRDRSTILEEIVRLIYNEWFGDFRYPGHESVPLVDSEIGPIPQGWEVMAASAAIQIDPRLQIPKDTPVRFVPMGSVSETTSHIAETHLRTNPGGARFANSDTLFARITPCLENGKTAYVQLLRPEEVGAGSTEFIVLRSRSLSPEFVYFLARSDRFREHAIKSMSGASGRQRVRREALDSYKLAVPPSPLLGAFREIVEPLMRESHLLFTGRKILVESRDLLLPRLISGEIDVADFDFALEDGAA